MSKKFAGDGIHCKVRHFFKKNPALLLPKHYDKAFKLMTAAGVVIKRGHLPAIIGNLRKNDRLPAHGETWQEWYIRNPDEVVETDKPKAKKPAKAKVAAEDIVAFGTLIKKHGEGVVLALRQRADAARDVVRLLDKMGEDEFDTLLSLFT